MRSAPSATIKVASPHFRFSAAHFVYFDDGTCEPLHGHDYRVVVELTGRPSPAGLLLDFLHLEQIVREILLPLDHRVLIPGDSSWIRVSEKDGEVHLLSAGKRRCLPREDCCFLPVPNTTAEHLVAYLGETVRAALRQAPDFPQTRV
ncbi:MAG: 6-pyruvoyl tetrahydropterin synthase family protein, partial [Thermogutta sp.]|nr:6-pyruvoyl tetrahydropterin synthase family protein [Thermogutta sp.]